MLLIFNTYVTYVCTFPYSTNILQKYKLYDYLGYAANNPNVFYFENGEATALITRKVNGNGLHGHAQTGIV